MDASRIGKYIAEKRNLKGLTQKQLADQLLVSDKAVSKWERGVCLPNIELLLPMAEALGVSVTELLSAGEDCEVKDDKEEKEVKMEVACRTISKWLFAAATVCAILYIAFLWRHDSEEMLLCIFILFPLATVLQFAKPMHVPIAALTAVTLSAMAFNLILVKQILFVYGLVIGCTVLGNILYFKCSNNRFEKYVLITAVFFGTMASFFLFAPWSTLWLAVIGILLEFILLVEKLVEK